MANQYNFKNIKDQSCFCMELMKRLNKEISASGVDSWSGMENHIRHQNDIKRLRRELMILSKMLNPWEGNNI